MKLLYLLLFISAAILRSIPIEAQTNPPEPKVEAPAEVKEETSITQHKMTVGGKELSYTAKAGTYAIRKEQDKPLASMFYVAYTLDNPDTSQPRPVTFCFNGGPGSSSVWLHLGAFGPQRIAVDGIGYPALPHHLEDNPHTLLTSTDLVFIDPIATGYSRPAPGEDAKQFFGYEEDVASVAEFIRLYLIREERWESPKFLAGESYGTTRAAGLAGHLLNKNRIGVQGIILVSSVLDFTVFQDSLSYIRYLPTFAAMAWQYRLLAPEYQNKALTDFLPEVETFAVEEYAPGILQGDELAPEKRQRLLEKLSAYTSLSKDYLDRADLCVPMDEFNKELLRKRDRTIGRFDGRYLGIDYNRNASSYEYDPSLAAVFNGFMATISNYLRKDLKYVTDLDYRVLAEVGPWKYTEGDNQLLDVSRILRRSIVRNPNLNVFVASGYFDLAIPYFSTKLTFNTMGLPHVLRQNVTLKNYQGGHMIFLERDTQKILNQDITQFIEKTAHEPVLMITMEGIAPAQK